MADTGKRAPGPPLPAGYLAPELRFYGACLSKPKSLRRRVRLAREGEAVMSAPAPEQGAAYEL